MIPLDRGMTIVVPIDFSEASEHGLEYAVSLAKEPDARLVLIHVMVYKPAYHEMSMGMDWFSPDLVKETEEKLRHLAMKLVPPRVTVVTDVLVEPSIERAIVGFTSRIGADMIVMGTRSRHGLDRWLLGSVARDVLSRAKCPTITVGPAKELHEAA